MILQIIESVLPMVGGEGSSIYHSWRFHFKILTTNKFFLGTRYLFYEISFSIFPLIEEQWTIAAWKYVCSDPLCCVYIKNVYISVKSFNSARYYISFSSFQVFHCIGENSPTHLNCSCLPAQVRKQSCKMSNLLHGPKSSNQILPREMRVNADIFSASNQQNRP